MPSAELHGIVLPPCLTIPEQTYRPDLFLHAHAIHAETNHNEGSFFEFSDPDVFAVGFELFSFFGQPITVFGDGGTLLGSAVHPVGTPFFGVVSSEPITSVSANAGAVAVYDNLQFGQGFIDSDDDGFAADDDACPLSDLVGLCAEGARNHGQYVRCTSHLTNDLKKSGLITGRDKGAIMSCAARSDLP